jgi:hypothetical protein
MKDFVAFVSVVGIVALVPCLICAAVEAIVLGKKALRDLNQEDSG